MIRRLLLLIAAVVGLIWLWRRGRRAAARRAVRQSRHAGRMVRDRVCGTFLPEERALSLLEPEGRVYFCSATCRDRHRAAAARAKTASR